MFAGWDLYALYDSYDTTFASVFTGYDLWELCDLYDTALAQHPISAV